MLRKARELLPVSCKPRRKSTARVGLLPYMRETQPWPQRPDLADWALQHPAKASPGGGGAAASFRRKGSIPHLREPEHTCLSGNFLFFIFISWIFMNTLFEKKDYVLAIILPTKHSIWKEKCSINAYLKDGCFSHDAWSVHKLYFYSFFLYVNLKKWNVSWESQSYNREIIVWEKCFTITLGITGKINLFYKIKNM